MPRIGAHPLPGAQRPTTATGSTSRISDAAVSHLVDGPIHPVSVSSAVNVPWLPGLDSTPGTVNGRLDAASFASLPRYMNMPLEPLSETSAAIVSSPPSSGLTPDDSLIRSERSVRESALRSASSSEMRPSVYMLCSA